MSAMIIVILLFAAALVTAVLLAIFRKKNKKAGVWVAVAFVPTALAAVLVTGITFAALPSVSARPTASVAVTAENGYLDMALALLTQGQTVGAEKILNEYAAEYPVNDRYMLAKARTEALRRSYEQADGLYRYLAAHSALDKESFTPEHNEVTLLMQGGGTYEKLCELIFGQIQQAGLPEEALTAARIYAETDSMEEGYTSSATASTAAEQYKTVYEAHPYLFASSAMELSYFKVLSLAKDYGTIVAQSPYYTDSHSLLALAELCRSGKISASVLRGSDVSQQLHDKNERLSRWIEQQERSHSYEEHQELLENTKALLAQSDISTPKAYRKWLKARLLAMAESGEEKEASKLYLSLARLNFGDDTTDQNGEYIRKALMTAGDSEDSQYAGAAAAINAILEDRDNTEALKEIDAYVEQMVAHMTAEEMQTNFGSDLSDEDRAFVYTVADRLWVPQPEEESSAMNEIVPGLIGTAGDDLSVALLDSEYDSEEESDDDSAEKQAFTRHVTAQVNQITSSINITAVDASRFEEVSLTVAVDESIATDAESFRKHIEIYDCDNEIKDYQVTKLEDEQFNIILICDNSGSMSGSKIRNLKEALRTFVNNLSGEVRVGIVSFDDSVLTKCSAPLGAGQQELLAAIDKMGDYGGTDILDGVNEGMTQAQTADGLNVLIVMSDGQDSMPSDNVRKNISEQCGQHDMVIYAMGLGSDVDSEVLSAYSQAGGGSYTYVSDSNALLSFYQYLYGISRNRYRVTYTAQDTLLVNRKAMAVYREDAKVSDIQRYTIGNDPDGLGEDDLGEDYEIALQDLTISGLDTRMIYRSAVDKEVHLLGQGLTKDTEIAVSLRAGMSYDLVCAYESDTSWKVTIPASIACGEYDVIVKVNGKRCVFTSGLVVASKTNQTLRFGQYVFEASNVTRLDHEIRLSGYVTLNHWLGFTSGVTLQGDFTYGDSITLSARNAYVSYQKGDERLNLFGQQMAQIGAVVRIPQISELRLYRNENIAPSSEDFRTDAVWLGTGLTVQNLLELNTPGLRLYPDRLELNFSEFSTALPMQDKLLKAADLDKLFKYSVDHEEKLLISETGVDCALEIQAASSDEDAFDPLRFGNMKLYANLNDFALKIDTKQGDYSMKLAVNIAMLADGLGLELGWKDGHFDTAKIYADVDINTTISGVPVTFSDFSLGVTDVSDKGLAGMTLQGSCDISVMKVSAYLPKLEKFVGDVSILTFDDTTLSLSLGRQYIGLSTKVTLLELAEIGQADIKLGLALPYSNTLLGYDEEPVAGLVGSYQKGFKVEGDNCLIDIGAGGGLALTDSVLGLSAEGKIKYELKWWVFSAGDQLSGKAFVGMYRKHSGDYVFAFIAGQDGKKPVEIEWNPKAVIA